VAGLKVGQQSRVDRVPAAQPPGGGAGRRGAPGEEAPDPAEVVDGPLGRDGDHRQAETATDRLGDRPGGQALLGGGVQH
jgi:hypothetical protein